MIVACSRNRVIGKEGRLPWSIPEDWQYLLDNVRGHVIIEGRKAFEELNEPLPETQAVVLTRSPGWQGTGAVAADSLPTALAMANTLGGSEIWICGGERVYEEAMPYANELYLTLVHTEIPDGDAFFPPWDVVFDRELSRIESHSGGYPLTYFRFGRSTPVLNFPI